MQWHAATAAAPSPRSRSWDKLGSLLCQGLQTTILFVPPNLGANGGTGAALQFAVYSPRLPAEKRLEQADTDPV